MTTQTNAALTIADLRDIALPEPVSWWPLAPGAWVVLLLVLAVVSALAWSLGCRWRANAYRRTGLRELAGIEARLPDPTVCADLSLLLKRVALAAFPREQVASLYGEAWVQFLDATCPGCRFAGGPGPLLFQGLETSRQTLEEAELRGLVEQSRRWIGKHLKFEVRNSKSGTRRKIRAQGRLLNPRF